MIFKLLLIILAEAYLIWSANSPNAVKPKWVQCSFNDKWFRNTSCSLKIFNNRSVLLYANSYLHRPVTAPMVAASIERWANGFRPFLSTFWSDGCKMLANPRSRNVVVKVFMDMLLRYTNVNHTCPLHGNMIVRVMDFSLPMIPSLLVTGTYRLILEFSETTRENVIFTFRAKGVVTSKLLE